MKNNRIGLIIIILIINSFQLLAQGVPTDPITRPTIIPPSPEAQSFMRYGDYPVDYSTGVAKIDVALYTIKSGELSLPLSISYHPSGIKVSDVASVVGLGWTLNTGGAISRVVKGFPDEMPLGMLNYPFLTESVINNSLYSSNPGYSAVGNFLEGAAKGYLDCESDNYSYSINNGPSGQFVYDKDGALQTLSFTSDKIFKKGPSTVYPYAYWYEVTGDNGVRYVFDRQEFAMQGNDYNVFPTSWWLTKIISADEKDVITFEYQVDNNNPQVDISMSQSWTFGLGESGDGNSGLQFSRLQSTSYPVQVKKINFKNGYVEFNYNQDRIDMQLNRLSSIKIYNSANVNPIQSFGLEQSYFWSGYANDKYNYRLKLDKLNVYDKNNAKVNNYSFNYNEDHILPPYINPANEIIPYLSASFAIDYWGYYNGKTSNPNLLPVLPAPYQAANRTADINYTKSCILNKITYPTGGSTTFEYEPNIANGGGVTGGLRIHRILSSTDATAKPVIKRYGYSNNLINKDISLDAEGNYSYEQEAQANYSGLINDEHHVIYMDNPVMPYASHNGSPAIYQFVDEYQDDVDANTSLKTTYVYQAEPDIVYTVNSPRFQDQYIIDRSWRKGQLGGTFYYKLNNGTYVSTKSVDNFYSDYRVKSIISGIKVQPKLARLDAFSSCANGDNHPISDCYFYFNTSLEIGSKKILRQTTTDYDPSGVNKTEKITTYSYTSPDHLYPTSTEFNDSRSNLIKTETKYAYDYVGTPVYDNMISKNIVSNVIQESKSVNAVFLKSTKTNYKDWGNSIIKPEIIETQVGNNPSEPRLHYYAYDDNGNVASVAKENDVKSTYIWGYNLEYPIAEVTNAASDQIAYTSFESADYGNWTCSGNPVIDASAMSGNKIYDPSNGAVTKSITTAGEYIISYWSKFGVKTIIGTTSTQGRNVNGWTYYEHKGTFAIGDVVTISGSGYIDELRLYPSSAKMSSYTYAPLIGKTTMADPSGEITYYEYDDFNRLKNIKDYLGNIVKNFQYNYQNSCGNNCVVLPMQTFTSYNTPGYPVGVFNGAKQYIGTANNASEYVTLWNNNTANQAIGVLSAGADPLHFNLSLVTGAQAPACLFGLRFYKLEQYYGGGISVLTDIQSYVDFGDGVSTLVSNNRINVEANTLIGTFSGAYAYSSLRHDQDGHLAGAIHGYSNSDAHTITVFHNETTEAVGFTAGDGDDLGHQCNITGNYPVLVKSIFNGMQTASDLGVTNFSTLQEVIKVYYDLSSIRHNSWQSLNNFHKLKWAYVEYPYASEIMSNLTANFPALQVLDLRSSDIDVSQIFSTTGFSNGYYFSYSAGPSTPVDRARVDLLLQKQAASTNQSNGYISVIAQPGRTHASDAAYNQLIAAGWIVQVGNVQ